MDIDLLLAIAHHLAVFALVGIFAAEFALLRPGLAGARVRQLARLDAVYGGMATLVIIVGVLRVSLSSVGWQYYVGNHAFWGKMAAFLVMGLLTIPPTLAIRRWSKALDADVGHSPDVTEIASQRRFIHLQAAVLLLIPILAAIMARGYGS
jgi:putative membrane protein